MNLKIGKRKDEFRQKLEEERLSLLNDINVTNPNMEAYGTIMQRIKDITNILDNEDHNAQKRMDDNIHKTIEHIISASGIAVSAIIGIGYVLIEKDDGIITHEGLNTLMRDTSKFIASFFKR